MYFLHDLSPFVIKFGNDFGLRWYGLAYVLAFLLGGSLYHWLAKRGYTDLPADQVSDFITWAAVFGVMIGGRLGWVIFYGWNQVIHDPLSLFKVWEGGMASHGGILGLVIFTFYWARTRKVSWTSIGDCLVVVAPIGLFLVRLANFENGELYGRPAGAPGGVASVPWAMLFPKELEGREALERINSIPENFQQLGVPFPLDQVQHNEALRHFLRGFLTPRHPSQLYEALLEGVVLFSALWLLRTRCRVPRGVITGAFFILYAILRIVGEMFREPDPAWHVGPVSAGQFLSIFMVFIGAAFVVFGYRTKEYEKVFTERTETADVKA